MRRMNNLLTLFTAMVAFFFGFFITKLSTTVDKCPTRKSGIHTLEPHPELFLMILIFSAPHYGEKRKAIRDTWINLGTPLTLPYYPEDFVYLPYYKARSHLQLESTAEQRNLLRFFNDWIRDENTKKKSNIKRNIKVKHYFAIGVEGLDAALRHQIEKEQNKHMDLLLLPRLTDTYYNLTEKLLHSLDALTHHYDFSYLLKVDDDTYVKLDYLLNELVSYDRKLIRKSHEYRGDPVPNLYWGYFNGRANIKSKGQWSEKDYYLSNRYITYALGGGYIISRKLCEYVANNSHSLSTYTSEDISMGTWLAPFRNVYRRHDPRFDTSYMPRYCREYHLILHKRNETIMKDLYNNKLCSFETRPKVIRPREYFYDWTKNADNCCDNHEYSEN